VSFLNSFAIVDVLSYRPSRDNINTLDKITNGNYYEIYQNKSNLSIKIFNVIKGMIHGKCFQQSIYENPILSQRISELSTKKYDLVIVETYWLYTILSNYIDSEKILLASHSVESKYLFSRLQRIYFPKILIKFLLKNVCAIEEGLIKSNKIISMGSVPANIFESKYPPFKCTYRYPNTLSTTKFQLSKIISKNKSIAIIGDFYYYPNYSGLYEFSTKFMMNFLNLVL
jgi:hypothetical protein